MEEFISNKTLDLSYVAQDISDITVPSPRLNRDFNCHKLVHGDDAEQERVRAISRKNVFSLSDEHYIEMTKDCAQFRTNRAYTMHALSAQEAEFPIAFSMLMFKDVEQFERLLRAVYRPQNYYCIHVDSKSPAVVHKAVEGIASCFNNVFVMSISIDVRWAYFSVVEPELMCMRELIKYTKWRYVCVDPSIFRQLVQSRDCFLDNSITINSYFLPAFSLFCFLGIL